MIVIHLQPLVKAKQVFVQTLGCQMNGVDAGKMADGLNAALGGALLARGCTASACGSLLAMAQS
jgi:hypothetical protein